MKRIIFIIVEIVLAISIIIAMVFNAINNKQFWDFSFIQGITVIVAIFIAFLASQYKNDERKQKETVEKLIHKLQDTVSNGVFYYDKEYSDIEINQNNRKINNIIDILSKYSKSLKYEQELEYISKQFKEYKEFVGEKINDKDYLAESTGSFKRYSENICNNCDRIIIELYK